MRKYMLNGRHIPVDLSCKLFDTLIRPIILYNSEIWFMDEYFSVTKSIQRSIANNTYCDKWSLSDKHPFEKIHTRFCKSVLGLRKTASNFAAKAELGRLPLESFIKTQVIAYYSRLNTLGINPLLKDAFNLTKKLSEERVYTWYSFASSIIDEVKLDKDHIHYLDKHFHEVKSTIKNICKKRVKESYLEIFTDKIDRFDNSSKLFLYSKLKTELQPADYLSLINFNSRQCLTKLRISDHNLEIELGRYKKIAREDRHCKICKVLDDEYHFLFHCKINEEPRNKFTSNIILLRPDYNQLDSDNKIKVILNPDMNVLPTVLDFIKQSLEMRK